MSTHYKRLTVSRKHTYIILTPINPHFYIVKLGFTGVYIIFLISAQKIEMWYSLELPQWTSGEEIWKISEFLSEVFLFWL